MNGSPQELAHHLSLLSPDEKERAKRFFFQKDRHRFIMGRGLLRSILGSYLEKEPAQIEFAYGQHGKPSLRPETHEKVLEFNLSHSEDIALYAVGWNRPIGIDIEHIRPMPDIDKFAEEFFSPSENTFINFLSGNQKEEAFFKIWTCKEAFLKANGSGITVPINQVELSMENEKAVALNVIGRDSEQASHWHLEIFNPLPGYQAALAIEGYDGQIGSFDYSSAFAKTNQ